MQAWRETPDDAEFHSKNINQHRKRPGIIICTKQSAYSNQHKLGSSMPKKTRVSESKVDQMTYEKE